jgi:hypothetical protein
MEAGTRRRTPRSENPDLHPTDEKLFVGTPDLGHPDAGATVRDGRPQTFPHEPKADGTQS